MLADPSHAPLTDPEDYERPDRADFLTVTFEGRFLDRVDRLVEELADVSGRREAVGTAVAVLSRYAGRPLYVEVDGQMRVIDRLWKSQ